MRTTELSQESLWYCRWTWWYSLPDLKTNSWEIIRSLLDIYNEIRNGGVLPSQWREATIIPIPKAGKNLSDPGNYHPIALTSCICKTFERMVNTRLVWYLEYHSILTAHQSGFRKRRSNTDQLIKLEILREGFIKRQHMVGIFFDLEKSYNTTWKYGILKDLYNAGLQIKHPILRLRIWFYIFNKLICPYTYILFTYLPSILNNLHHYILAYK